MSVLEDVVIRISAINEALAPIAKAQAQTEALGKAQEELTEILDKGRKSWLKQKKFSNMIESNTNQLKDFAKAHRGFFGVLGENRQILNKGAEGIRRYGTRGAKAALGIRRFTQGMRGFRMEMLSVMFFGQGLFRFFTGLFKPSLKVAGIFELLTAVLEILFLPLVLSILPVILKLADFIFNLSDKTKLWIGKLVVFGAIFGLALGLFGAGVLAIGGLIGAFAGLFIILDKLIPDISVAGVNMSSFIEAGLGITILGTAWQAFKGILSSILSKFFEFEFVKGFLDEMGLKVDDQATGWENLKSVITQAWDKIKAKLKEALGDIEVNVRVKGGSVKMTLGAALLFWRRQFEKFVDSLTGEKDELVTSIKDILSSFKELFELFDKEDAITVLTALAEAIHLVASAIRTWKSVNRFTEDKIGFVDFQKSLEGGSLNTNQTGGFVPHTGLYKLHAGETVSQAGGGDTFNSSPTINISGAGLNSDSLVREISNAITRDLGSLARR
ncbi:MAG: hypothetical protein CL811_06630 [Colwelliaceae bacterium]|jgi:hypothetical protein|nr:hypothetical protein [Colwelliaceae bacterium]|tara:strand:- start:11662 stop:13161 length:1500 start_codon:yes stop_codon:yes gene_type:complete